MTMGSMVRLSMALGGVLAICGPGLAGAAGFTVEAVSKVGGVFVQSDGSAAGASFRGAILMSWDRKRFREFSGLHTGDGTRLFTVSDRGTLLQVTLVHRDGWLVGASDPVLSRLRGPDGGFLKRKDGDAESLASDGQGGLIVAFEHRPRLLHYRPPFLEKPTVIALPEAVAQYPKNRGIEASTRLCDGTLLVLAQGVRAGVPNAWIGGPAGWVPRHYLRTRGYSPTGATTLPDCSVAVLERRKSGKDVHDMRVRRLSAAALRTGGGSLEATGLIGPFSSLTYKFEGITVARRAPGTLMLYLISDSGPQQGTMLVAFALLTSGEGVGTSP